MGEHETRMIHLQQRKEDMTQGPQCIHTLYKPFTVCWIHWRTLVICKASNVSRMILDMMARKPEELTAGPIRKHTPARYVHVSPELSVALLHYLVESVEECFGNNMVGMKMEVAQIGMRQEQRTSEIQEVGNNMSQYLRALKVARRKSLRRV